MTLLALVGLSVLLSPALAFFVECGWRADGGDFTLWLMAKTPEQIWAMRGCSLAGATLMAAAFAQGAWVP